MDFSQMPVTIILMAINLIGSLIGFSNGNFVDKMIGWPYYEKKDKQYYRWITSAFLHADWMHLIFNMFTLYSFGRNIEVIFSAGHLGGKFAYLALYFLGIIASSVPSYIKHRHNYQYRSLGASGAVSAVLFASILFMPWARIGIFIFPFLSGVLFAALYIIYCVYMSKRNADNIGHDAHLGGALFGIIFTIILIAVMRPDIFPYIIDDLKNPSLFGRNEINGVLQYIWNTR